MVAIRCINKTSRFGKCRVVSNVLSFRIIIFSCKVNIVHWTRSVSLFYAHDSEKLVEAIKQCTRESVKMFYIYLNIYS